LDDLWGRTGPGTAKVTLQFFRGDRPFWSRTNTFFSEKDVMSDAVKEFGELTALFAQNQFRDLSPLSVRVDVEATATPRILYIEEIDVDEDRVYAPGDVVKVVLRIRPWREEPRTRTVTLRIPKDAEGPLELLVRGGGIEEPGQDAIEAGSRAIADFDTLLRELGAKEANQELIVELREPRTRRRRARGPRPRIGSRGSCGRSGSGMAPCGSFRPTGMWTACCGRCSTWRRRSARSGLGRRSGRRGRKPLGRSGILPCGRNDPAGRISRGASGGS
jgi:hypothetical protein